MSDHDNCDHDYRTIAPNDIIVTPYEMCIKCHGVRFGQPTKELGTMGINKQQVLMQVNKELEAQGYETDIVTDELVAFHIEQARASIPWGTPPHSYVMEKVIGAFTAKGIQPTPKEPARRDSKTNLETSYDLRKQFVEDVDNWKTVGKTDLMRVLVVAVQHEKPDGTGYVETITNHGDEQVREKLDYYLNSYDEYFSLKNKPAIRIVAYFIV